MCKWTGQNDIKVMRNEAAKQDALERMRIELWAADHLHSVERETTVCEVCGMVDPCVDNGVCAECRQGMQIG